MSILFYSNFYDELQQLTLNYKFSWMEVYRHDNIICQELYHPYHDGLSKS